MLTVKLGTLIARFDDGSWTSESERFARMLNRVMRTVETDDPTAQPFDATWLADQMKQRVTALEILMHGHRVDDNVDAAV